MASSGAGVMMARSIEIARSHNVKLHIRSTFSDEEGTWIQEEDELLEKALISGVVHQREETVYYVDGVAPARLFGALAEASVNVDTIVQTGSEEIVFSTPPEDRGAVERTLDRMGVTWSAREGLGKVSVVGAGMKSHPGVAAKTFATLEAAGIEPAVVSTSPIKIACHVADGRRRPRRHGPPRGIRPWLALLESAWSAQPAPSEPLPSGCSASAATSTCVCSRPPAPPARSSTGSASRRRRRGTRSRRDVDLALFSVGTSASRELVPHAVRGGAVCVDKSAAYRLEPGVPLVVPEVNGARALENDGIVANPNCCTIPLTCVLKPLYDAAGLARVRIATYQSVSGAGAQAMDRLRNEPSDSHDLRMDWEFDGEEFDEESKLRAETRKIMELPELPISATCVRVPIMVGHAEAVWIETEQPLSAEDARRLLEVAPSVRVLDFPSPGQAAGGDDVLVGRIRPDRSAENGLALFIVGGQPAQGRRAERDPDRRAAARPATRRSVGLVGPRPGSDPRHGQSSRAPPPRSARIDLGEDAPRHTHSLSGHARGLTPGMAHRASVNDPLRLRRARAGSGRNASRTRRSTFARDPSATACRPPSSSRTSSTRPSVRTVWKPKSERKSRGKTVLCTWKRWYADSPSGNRYANVSSATAPLSLASPIAARKRDCSTHGLARATRYAQVIRTASSEGGPAGRSAARAKTCDGPYCIDPSSRPSSS